MRKIGISRLLYLSAISCVLSMGPAFSADLKKVTYLMHAFPSPFDMPLYYAKDKGLFEKEGLDVEIVPGRTSQDAINALAAGNAFIASAQGSSAMQGIAKGQSVVMIGSRLGVNASAIVADKGITSLKQLTGKRIGVPFSTLEKVVRLMLEKEGIDPDSNEYILISQPVANVNAFAEGKLDAVVTTAPYAEQVLVGRREASYFVFGEHGVTDPGYVFATSTENLRDDKETIGKFLRAVYSAYREVDSNLDEAAEITSRNLTDAKVDFIKSYYEGYRKYFCSPEQKGKPLGYLPIAGIEAAQLIYKDAGIVDRIVDVDVLGTNAFFEGPDAIETLTCE